MGFNWSFNNTSVVVMHFVNYLSHSFTRPLHVVLVFLLFLLIACGENVREEVTDRYPTGEKKEILIYEGEGTDEQLVERRTYTKNGELIRIEDVAKNDTLYYGEIKSRLSSPSGLRDFLSRKSWKYEGDGFDRYFQFTKDSVYFLVDREYTGSQRFGSNSVAYLKNWKIAERNKKGVDTLNFCIERPNTIQPSKCTEDISAEFKRIEEDVRQSVHKLRAAQAREEREKDLSAEDTEITLSPVGNQMRYRRDELTVARGETVRLVLDNTATSPSMQHNVVLVNGPPSQSTFQEIGQAGIVAGRSQDYVPDRSEVIAATPIAGPGETVSVTFTAPSTPGKYGFVCTFPGHWATQQGTMRVITE